MRFYLASWVGEGTEDNPFRPSVGEEFAAVDLRPDSTVQAGRALVATPEPVATVPQGVLDVGELDANLPRGVSRKIEAALGVTLDQTASLQAVIAELLILHGDNRPRGSRTRWRPLKATHRGRHKISMLGDLIYDAPAVEGAVITDDFNRPDSTGMGSSSEGWSWTVWRDINIASNQAVAVSAPCAARAESDLASDDHYSQADCFVDSNADRPGLGVRMGTASSSNWDRYFFWARTDTAPSFQYFIEKTVSTTTTRLATLAGTFVSGDTLRMEVDGSSLEVFRNGGSVGTTTDTDITGNLRAGLSSDDLATGFRWDNFAAGDLGAAFDPANLQASAVDDDVTLSWDASF